MEAAVRLDNYEGPVQPEDREIPNPLVIRPVSGFGGTKESFIADLQDCVQCSIHNFWDKIQSNTRKINLCARFGHHYIFLLLLSQNKPEKDLKREKSMTVNIILYVPSK